MREIIEFSKTLKVLFCEDDEIVRGTIEKLLKRFFDDITIAIDGADGLEKFKTKEFDLIFTDINMPNINGLEMLKVVRSDENIEQMPIIMLTTDETKKTEALELGANGFLMKPIRNSDLVETISSVII